jgi:simple sugar transport system permease protein
MNELALLIASSIASGTPLAIAALGLIINERAGVINLGSEGLMLVAAIAGFAAAVHGQSQALGLLAGASASAALCALLAGMLIWLQTNQYATGLALSLFGSGLSAFVGMAYTQEHLGAHPASALPGLSKLPFLGTALFSQHPVVYFSLLLTALSSWFLFHSKAGLVLRAVGESPEAAQALGYPVRWIRFAAVVLGGALLGLAGAYVSVVSTPLWVEGMIAGKGWIALALTAFATWRPARALLGAYLFGGVTMLQLHLQGRGVSVPVELLSALPYLSTIFVLVLISRNPRFIAANMPASLGKPFHPGA